MRTRLDSRPVLASWDRAESPGQRRLAAFLDSTVAQADPVMAGLSGPLSLLLEIGLTGSDLEKNKDLDNFLYPLIKRLGPERFRVAHGIKGEGAESFLTIQELQVEEPLATDRLEVETTASAETAEFKRQIRSRLHCLGAREIAEGPVRMEIDYVVGPRRVWPNLWKATIDACGPLLGQEDSGREWAVRDGRIVDLRLRVSVDLALAHKVRMSIKAMSVLV